MKYQLLVLACYAFTSLLPLSSAGVSITSSVGISIKPKKSNSSFGSVELSVELSKGAIYILWKIV